MCMHQRVFRRRLVTSAKPMCTLDEVRVDCMGEHTNMTRLTSKPVAAQYCTEHAHERGRRSCPTVELLPSSGRLCRFSFAWRPREMRIERRAESVGLRGLCWRAGAGPRPQLRDLSDRPGTSCRLISN